MSVRRHSNCSCTHACIVYALLVESGWLFALLAGRLCERGIQKAMDPRTVHPSAMDTGNCIHRIYLVHASARRLHLKSTSFRNAAFIRFAYDGRALAPLANAAMQGAVHRYISRPSLLDLVQRPTLGRRKVCPVCNPNSSVAPLNRDTLNMHWDTPTMCPNASTGQFLAPSTSMSRALCLILA